MRLTKEQRQRRSDAADVFRAASILARYGLVGWRALENIAELISDGHAIDHGGVRVPHPDETKAHVFPPADGPRPVSPRPER